MGLAQGWPFTPLADSPRLVGFLGGPGRCAPVAISGQVAQHGCLLAPASQHHAMSKVPNGYEAYKEAGRCQHRLR